MNEIDIVEQWLLELDPRILELLLLDRTTKGNIKWATDDYSHLGEGYAKDYEIKIPAIATINTHVIQPRVAKDAYEQERRRKNNAEVFTPAWICNRQNNMVDAAWFGRNDVFNKEKGTYWETNEERIVFPSGKTWQDYVLANRLEISCGEAPYLVSRYDAVTGGAIVVPDRIGLLDRKLRVINENVDKKKEWFMWVKRAYQSVFGYDYQGDNVLLARENLLYTVIDNRRYKFGDEPTIKQLEEIAAIISWNIWQMDGITFETPFSNQVVVEQPCLFVVDDIDKEERTEPQKSKIYDWERHRKIVFEDLMKGA